MRRNLAIQDKNKVNITEEDFLVIDLAKVDSGFWRSNMGRECKEQNATRVEIQLKNTYPLLKVEYSLTFIPSMQVEELNDYTFLRFLVSECENQTKLPGVDVDFSLPQLTEVKTQSGQDVLTLNTLEIPRANLDFSKLFKPDYLIKAQEAFNQVEKMQVEVTHNGFLISVSYCFLDKDNVKLTRKAFSGLSEKEFSELHPEDQKFYLEAEEETSMPFQNHGIGILKNFAGMI